MVVGKLSGLLVLLVAPPSLFRSNNRHWIRGVRGNIERQPPRHHATASRIQNVALSNDTNNGSRIRNDTTSSNQQQRPGSKRESIHANIRSITRADHLQNLLTGGKGGLRRRRRRLHRFLPALRLNQLLRLFVLERGRNRNYSGGENGDGGDTDIMPRSKKKMYFTCFAIVSAWISLGTLFYASYYQWPLPQSFFYAVDAGMSIGFCTDVAETDAASRAFTVVHILLGASCVGGALVLLVQSVLEGVASREASVYRLILEVDSFKKAFMSGSRSDSGSGASYNWLSKKEKGVLSYPDFRQVLNDNGLPELTNREYQRICSFYDPHTEGCIRYERFAQNFEGVRRILPMTRFVHHGSFPWPILARTWDAAYSLFTNEHHRIYLIFVLWIGMGVTWGIVDQGWDPITATHFAVSALATGGLTAPPVDPTTGILPTGPALFCGFYCLFGIPLMALTLGIFARVLVEGYIVEEELAAIARPLSRSEFMFASKSLCSRDDALHLSDYIVLQLMRQGKLNLESFEFMKRQYGTLDCRRFWLKSVGTD